MKDPFTGKPLTPSEEALLRRALRLWGLFALGALVAGWLALWIVSLTQPVIVPRIVGLSDKEAQRLLKSKSLKMTVEGRQTDEHLGPDSVVTQKPIANSYVRRGATIAVLLSKGTPQVKTPDLRGQSVRRAVVSLTQSRLRVGRRSYLATALFAPDTVLAQVPEAGVPVNTTTGVDLLLATGPEAPTYFMPYLRNHTLEEALRMFRPVGVVVQKIKTEVHDDLASGSILAQNPAIGTRLKPGSAVTLTVSALSGEASQNARWSVIRFQMPAGDAPKRLKIDVLDASGTRTVHTAMEPPGQMVETGVSVTGKASAQVYLNGVFIQEIKVE
jgi:serine/threonine-protein kinase